MDCNIIKDLIPLYIDECCSDDSKNTVQAHLSSCPLCRELYESMREDIETVAPAPVPKNISRINHWKASLLLPCWSRNGIYAFSCELVFYQTLQKQKELFKLYTVINCDTHPVRLYFYSISLRRT